MAVSCLKPSLWCYKGFFKHGILVLSMLNTTHTISVFLKFTNNIIASLVSLFVMCYQYVGTENVLNFVQNFVDILGCSFPYKGSRKW